MVWRVGGRYLKLRDLGSRTLPRIIISSKLEFFISIKHVDSFRIVAD
jgi:hypothetical protein